MTGTATLLLLLIQTNSLKRLRDATRSTVKYSSCFELRHYSTFLSHHSLIKMIGIHTACCSLFVHDTMSTFPAANGLPWLDLVFYATIFKDNLDIDEHKCQIILTCTYVFHLMSRCYVCHCTLTTHGAILTALLTHE
jgi:hypothetical protein